MPKITTTSTTRQSKRGLMLPCSTITISWTQIFYLLVMYFRLSHFAVERKSP
ncbi:hypothetical protein X975_00791, partial [Stegodyphus mimosarum]